MNIVEELTILLDKYKLRPDAKYFISLMPPYMLMDMMDDIYKDYKSLKVDKFKEKYNCDICEKKMTELEGEYKKLKEKYSLIQSNVRFYN